MVILIGGDSELGIHVRVEYTKGPLVESGDHPPQGLSGLNTRDGKQSEVALVVSRSEVDANHQSRLPKWAILNRACIYNAKIRAARCIRRGGRTTDRLSLRVSLCQTSRNHKNINTVGALAIPNLFESWSQPWHKRMSLLLGRFNAQYSINQERI